jgi:hypothetical protein
LFPIAFWLPRSVQNVKSQNSCGSRRLSQPVCSSFMMAKESGMGGTSIDAASDGGRSSAGLPCPLRCCFVGVGCLVCRPRPGGGHWRRRKSSSGLAQRKRHGRKVSRRIQRGFTNVTVHLMYPSDAQRCIIQQFHKLKLITH